MKKKYTYPQVEVVMFASTNTTNALFQKSSIVPGDTGAAGGGIAGADNLKHIGIKDLNH